MWIKLVRPMIIAMAGLPGTGKSTVARELALQMPAIIINKDEIRVGLFPPEMIEYSERQDDLVVNIMFQLADFYTRYGFSDHIILDGRTFSKKKQVVDLLAFSRKCGWDLRVILCTCSERTTRFRLESDRKYGSHPAEDRNFELYNRLKNESEQLDIDHFIVDTEKPIDNNVQKCIQYLREFGGV